VWQLVVVDSRLLDHLASLKDYLLLAKGDFYQGFITDATKLLALPASKAHGKDLGACVRHGCGVGGGCVFCVL
jgi:hypothetical protein